MKKSLLFIFIVALFGCCSSNNKNQQEQPLVTYLYDGNKEICLYANNTATVNGQSGLYYESSKDFYHTDGCSWNVKTREYIHVEYGSNHLIIWPGTGLVFFGMDNVNASFDNPSNDRIGKRCYRKR